MFSRIVRSASSVKRSRRISRRQLRKRFAIETLERRELLAADYLYSLEARPGVPDDGFGFSHAANDQFHVVANYRYPELNQPGFYGEIQVHDASTGELLRTIQNPLPYALSSGLTPNGFGYAVDIQDNLILVGSPGWEGIFVHNPNPGAARNTGGKAFLFDANTGDLLHTFDGFETYENAELNNDGFGRSVSIDGNRLAIAAYGPRLEDPELGGLYDNYPGYVYLFSTTGNFVDFIEDPLYDQNPNDIRDFGTTVTLSNGKLVVTQGTGNFSPIGPTLVYEAATTSLFPSELLHTLSINGSEAVIEGNNVAIFEAPGTTHLVNATTGAVAQTFAGRMYDFDGSLIVSGPASGDPTAFPVIRDFPSGNVLFSVPTPPNFVETYFESNQIPQIFEDRLLVPGRQGSATNNVVFVYSVTDGPGNGPPTDIALSNNSIPENSANNTVVGTLSATDPTPGETFTFSLLNSAGGRFSISGTQLRVANGSLLDFETDTSHNVTVRVTDSAGNNYNEVFAIQITNANDKPTDIQLNNDSVPENSANATVVGTLSATDIDPGETFTFSLWNSAGGRFGVNGNQLVVANGNALNYEANPSLHVGVRVTDSAGNMYDEQFLLHVTNVDEPITDLHLLDHKVVEQSPSGALIGAIDNPSPTVSDSFGTVAATSNRLIAASNKAPEAYIFDAVSLELLHTLQNPNPDSVFLAASVAISATHAVVGNPYDVTLGPAAGAVHIYDVATGDLQQTLYGPYPATGTFGTSVTILGNKLAVGGFFGEGRVFLFDLETGNLLQTLASPLPTQYGFGSSVAMTANHIIVGQGPSSGSSVGSAHIYSATTGSYLYSLNNPSPDALDFFGQKVRAVGNRVLISATGDDTVAENAGAAYLFDATTGALLHTFLPTGNSAVGIYGFSLDLNGNRIAIGAVGNSRVYFYDATTFELIQELPDVHFGNEGFGVELAFGGDRLFVGDYSNRGAYGSGEIQVFDALTGDLLPSFRVTPEDFADTYSYTLLDDAGGRFAISGNQLVVASGSDIDYETATSHTVTVQVTDAGGSSLTKQLTIDVIDANEPPTDIALSNSSVSESTVRVIHNLSADGTAFGSEVAAAGDYILASERIGESLPLQKRVHVIHATTGEQLRTFTAPVLNPTAEAPDGRFGDSFAIAGNRAYIGASSTKLGNLDNAGTVYVFDIASGNLLLTLNSPSPTAIGFFGGTLAISGNILAVSASNEAAGSIYLFDATTGQLLETVVNPTPSPGEAFGQFLALSGNTLVTSSRFEDVGAADAGVAYIYEFNPATSIASLTHTLNNPTPAPSETFGGAVAVAGNLVAVKDATTVAGVTNVGSVHLFDRLTGAFLRTIANPTPGANDQFAAKLILSGDLVIASSYSDIGGFNNGRAYVFQASTGALIATIQNPSPAASDEFAFRIAVNGSRIVASAVGDDTDGSNRGLVYVFDLPIGQPIGPLSTTDSDAGETFTYALINTADGRFAIEGNKIVIADATKLNFEAASSHVVTVQVTDGGGNTFSKDLTITVTQVNEAPQDMVLTGNTIPEAQVRFLHNLGPQAIPSFGYATAADGGLVVVGTNNLSVYNLPGEVSVYNTTGEHVSLLAAPSPQLGELFGENVAISGNLAVVTARNRNAGAGVAYVFNATTGALLHTLFNPTPASSGVFPDRFGSAVAISGNLIAVGAEEDLGAPDSGAVYLFDAVTGNLLQTIASPIPSIQSKFGNDLSLVGNTLVVGASLGNRAYIFEWNSANQSAVIVASLNVPPGGGGADFFGGAVTIVGNVVAVGASNSDAGASNSGQVHLFDRTTGSFLSSLNNPSPNANDNFGQVVAGNDTYLAVAAQNDDTDAVDSGRVYVFNPTTGELLSTIANPSPNVGDFFSRLSFAGNTLVVGAPTDDSDGLNAGMVFLFDLPIDQAVGSLATTDPDSGDSHTYALVNDADGRFGLVGNQIVVVDPSRLNFEVEASHSLTIQSTDSSGLSTYESFIIQVTNVNEPTTNINFAGNSVNEIAVNGTVVSTLSASDPDAGSTITYSLDNNAGGRFAIAGNTIVVANSALLDFETSSSHTVTVRATDSGGKFVLETLKINVIDAPEVFDFGDLPNSFGTTLAADGARHVLSNALRLGATVSPEANGQPSANANLDSGDDGVTLPFLLVPGLNATTTIAASQSSRLDAFIDFNGNGTFAESERITPAGGLLLNAGANTFTFAVPSSANSGNQGARFRVSTSGGLFPTGLAPDGEIEDYRINILVPNLLSSQLIADPEFPGLSMLYVKGSGNDDTITVNQNGGGLRATINGVQGAVLLPTSRIVIFGLGGDDDLRINGTTIPGYIDGGPDDDIIRGGNGPDLLFGRGGDDTIYGRNGDDTIYGGSGKDILESNGGIGFLFGEGNSDTLTGNGILVGGDGSDELTGTGARNVLIGGNGADLLTGANANQGDIIIAGITIHDSNLIALKAIRDEWKEPTPVNDRINHLNGSIPGGLNVPYYLNVDSVFLDNASDTIINFGSTNPTRDDWIFKSPNDIKVNPPGIVVTILNSPPATMSIQSFGSSNLESGQFNSNQPSDVNGDGFTTPLDVLMIVNHLNTSSQSPAVNGLAVGAFLDTNDDGAISPLDALVVINWLNQLSRFVSDDTPDDDSQFGEVDSVFGLLSEGEADLMDFWAGTDTELESSIHSLTFGTTKRRRR